VQVVCGGILAFTWRWAERRATAGNINPGRAFAVISAKSGIGARARQAKLAASAPLSAILSSVIHPSVGLSVGESVRYLDPFTFGIHDSHKQTSSLSAIIQPANQTY
jgi:hypothetical protein